VSAHRSPWVTLTQVATAGWTTGSQEDSFVHHRDRATGAGILDPGRDGCDDTTEGTHGDITTVKDLFEPPMFWVKGE
jgi:hypothetical protein